MANGHEILSSGNTSENLADSLINFMNDSVISFPNDEAINNISNFKTNLSFDDSGYLWKGDLSQLKCLSRMISTWKANGHRQAVKENYLVIQRQGLCSGGPVRLGGS